MHIFLKFSYFFVLIGMISCGDSTSKKTDEQSTEEAKQQTKIKSKTLEIADTKTILFFGNSLTAGYGLDTKESFPSLIQNRLDSLDLNYTVINAGLSGETTAAGKNRLGWVLKQKVDIFVLELGANDGLRGIPLDETRNNLQTIIDAVREKNSETKIVLAGMQIPPNMGQEYTKEFRTIFPDLAEKNDLQLIPFLLDGVAGIPDLNLPDGIHPTAEGQKIVRENVWVVLEGLL
ncbi:arylesterase [Maribacter algarum]|uniref:Arylesterase n=1 Tax=Maribacter algarum (ex Zhang et al. 2020) TaxID=2578118 RepID=A0A5S3PGT1_9FLAO|nr:arylesterase [Maribacter algarum]TMM53315.1 arylesterase [Maribacter algarum]